MKLFNLAFGLFFVMELSKFGNGPDHSTGSFPLSGKVQNFRFGAFPFREGSKTPDLMLSPLGNGAKLSTASFPNLGMVRDARFDAFPFRE